LRAHTGTDARANETSQMRKVEFQFGDRSDPRFVRQTKEALFPPAKPPTLLLGCVSLLGYSAVRTRFPVLRFIYHIV
jgi:hypothetical protein